MITHFFPGIICLLSARLGTNSALALTGCHAVEKTVIAERPKKANPLNLIRLIPAEGLEASGDPRHLSPSPGTTGGAYAIKDLAIKTIDVRCCGFLKLRVFRASRNLDGLYL